ncbi:hypothetical protein [Planctomyces sp. SH-PL62]|uniref:GP88 family protein n=1 Tax=Planctomyces sp. SH-PL62 TaxID=1636152 RepID=UPI00078D66F1|nr:hypothetical protein [Planctomyces sp. SH-PL62]AMV40484.1 hypothetical protein VT85_23845 [Planctomyces sp. SH-PL62]
MSDIVGPDEEPIYRVGPLLSDGETNHKQALGLSLYPEYLPVNLSLAPDRSSGYRVCRFATEGCGGGKCTYSAGNGNQAATRLPRIAKTRLFFRDRELFRWKLFYELEAFRERARREGRTLVVRLNTYSDLAWETLEPDLFTEFHDARFLDYTKEYERMTSELPPNYSLLFSRSEENDAQARELLSRGHNVSVVFEVAPGVDLPTRWPDPEGGFEVIDGDHHDYRFLDPMPRVVGLRRKGWRLGGDTTGFVVHPESAHLG